MITPGRRGVTRWPHFTRPGVDVCSEGWSWLVPTMALTEPSLKSRRTPRHSSTVYGVFCTKSRRIERAARVNGSGRKKEKSIKKRSKTSLCARQAERTAEPRRPNTKKCATAHGPRSRRFGGTGPRRWISSRLARNGKTPESTNSLALARKWFQPYEHSRGRLGNAKPPGSPIELRQPSPSFYFFLCFC